MDHKHISFPEYDDNVIARIQGKTCLYLMRKSRIVIGRSGTADIDVEDCHTFVSREHIELFYDILTNQLKLKCHGRNGIFIDGLYKKHNNLPYTLPKVCVIRFPSTTCCLGVEFLKSEKAKEDAKHTKSLVSTSTLPELTNGDKKCQLILKTDVNGKTEILSGAPFSESSGDCYIDVNVPDQPPRISTTKSILLDKGSTSVRPPYSFVQLISQAIHSANKCQITLSGIYDFISSNYPYFMQRKFEHGWQNSVRHTLSLSTKFIRVPRQEDVPGKGSFWRVAPEFQRKMFTDAYRPRLHQHRHRTRSALAPGVEDGKYFVNVLVVGDETRKQENELAPSTESTLVLTSPSLHENSAESHQTTGGQLRRLLSGNGAGIVGVGASHSDTSADCSVTQKSGVSLVMSSPMDTAHRKSSNSLIKSTTPQPQQRLVSKRLLVVKPDLKVGSTTLSPAYQPLTLSVANNKAGPSRPVQIVFKRPASTPHNGNPAKQIRLVPPKGKTNTLQLHPQ